MGSSRIQQECNGRQVRTLKGQIHVNNLNARGVYVSELDTDKAFAFSGNSCGYFKMVICPILNSDGKYEIRYMKDKDGYTVSGEGYIVSDGDTRAIDRRCRNYWKDDRFGKVVQTEVKTREALW